MEQLTDLLAADGVRLDTAALDRIDEIVAPGRHARRRATTATTRPSSSRRARRRR